MAPLEYAHPILQAAVLRYPVSPAPTGAQILKRVADVHKLTVADLKGPSRKAAICRARREAIAMIRHDTKLSSTQIGHLLGGRDHTTILHALKTWEAEHAQILDR